MPRGHDKGGDRAHVSGTNAQGLSGQTSVSVVMNGDFACTSGIRGQHRTCRLIKAPHAVDGVAGK